VIAVPWQRESRLMLRSKAASGSLARGLYAELAVADGSMVPGSQRCVGAVLDEDALMLLGVQVRAPESPLVELVQVAFHAAVGGVPAGSKDVVQRHEPALPGAPREWVVRRH
jgi:hypothetical protein